MGKLKLKPEMPTNELLYQLIKGLREVNKVLNRNPQNPKFKKAIFSFAYEKENTVGGKVLAVVGIEKYNTKKFSNTGKITLSPSKLKNPKIDTSITKWENSILYLDFGSQLIRRAYDLILPKRAFPEFAGEIEVKGEFILKDTANGLLKFELFDGTLSAEGKVGSTKIVTHRYSITYGYGGSLEKKKNKDDIT